MSTERTESVKVGSLLVEHQATSGRHPFTLRVTGPDGETVGISYDNGMVAYSDGRPVRYASVSTLDEAAIKRACDSTQRAWLTQSLASILDDVLAVKAAPESERRALLDAAKSLHDGGDLLVDRGDDFGAVAGVLRLFGEVADLLAKGVSVRGDLRRDEAVVDDRHESSPSTGGGDAATSPASEASVGEATVEPAGSSPACCCSCGAACSAGAGVTPVERARRTDGDRLTARDALRFLRAYHNTRRSSRVIPLASAEATYGDHLVRALEYFLDDYEEADQ